MPSREIMLETNNGRFLIFILLSVFIAVFINASAQPLAISSNSINFTHPDTKLYVNKTLDGTDGYPKLIYKITAPKVDYFEFVLALDSSGSIGLGPHKNAVLSAVPNFIEGISGRYPNRNFKVSIISWDNDTDFAYGNFANKDPKYAKLIDVENASQDIKDNLVKYYTCDEEEYTDLSKPVEASLDVFDTNPLNHYSRTRRFIILVVGEGEFSRCRSDLIQTVNNKNYSMYVIGMDVLSGSQMSNHLEELSGYNEEKRQIISSTDDKMKLISPTDEQLEKSLFDALNDALDKAVSEPVAENVTISETFYSYINPDDGSIRVNGVLNRGNNVLKYSTKSQDPIDKTYTIKFELARGLLPESETDITFDTKFSLTGMPMTVTPPPRQAIPIPPVGDNAQPSTFTYKWFNGEVFSVHLADVPTNIVSTSTSSRSMSGITATQESSISNSESESLGSNFGFAILSIFAILFGVSRRDILR
ncbi:MAG TPA: hypothetical protein PLK94_08800 [Alphaproteobacteria bacterium]|nr:hypothetical protein [Alphaproteobacteria bacterium]